MIFRTCLLFIALPALVSLLPSCAGTGNKEGGEESLFGLTGSGGTGGFLKTNHKDLSIWLDERFEVDYKHMTPQLIFDQVPLNDIVYETSNLPTEGEAFNLSSRNVSRRELLKHISEHWNLKMSLTTDASGTPVAVRVEG